MKLSTKRKVDHVLGLPILILFNFLARILGFILRRDHGKNPVKNILILKFQGIGSLAIAKPAIEKIRCKYPEAHLTFLGTSATARMAQEMTELDEILWIDDNSLFSGLRSLLPNLVSLWKRKIDWAFDLEVYSKLSTLLSTLTLARNRVGFAINTTRFRRNVHTHLVFFNRYMYLGQAYHQLFQFLIDEEYSQKFTPLKWRDNFFPEEKFAIERPYIVLNPNAGELALERKWPREHWDKLIDTFLKEHSEYQIVLVGHGKKEVEQSLFFESRHSIINLTGKLKLSELIGCFSQADLVISNDTAPLHLALSQDVPVLGIFGPTSPTTYFPKMREKADYIYEPTYCSPCVHHWDPPPCNGNNQCLKKITPEQVLHKSLKLLKKEVDQISPPHPQRKNSFFEGLIYQR